LGHCHLYGGIATFTVERGHACLNPTTSEKPLLSLPQRFRKQPPVALPAFRKEEGMKALRLIADAVHQSS